MNIRQAAVFSILFFLSPAICFADDGRKSDAYANTDDALFFIGEKTWQSAGDNTWSIAGTKSGGPPNILSELEFLGLKSTVVEVFGGLREGQSAITAAYGFGSMHGGVYRDSDYNQDDRQGLYSRSTGNADGDGSHALYYWSIDYRYRFFTEVEKTPGKKYMAMFIGYQEWHEEVVITNGFQEVCEPPNCIGPTGPFEGLNSQYEFIWRSLLIGIEGGVPVHRGLSLEGGAIFIPYTAYDGEGVWNLRSDFRQDPSFKHTARGGYGVQLEASAAYYLYPDFAIDIGYRYRYIKSGKGDDITYFSDGTEGATQFNGAISERKGPFLGFVYTF